MVERFLSYKTPVSSDVDFIDKGVTSRNVFLHAHYSDRHINALWRLKSPKLNYLFENLFRLTSKVHSTGLLQGVNSPHKWPVIRKAFPYRDVIMSLQWRHNGRDSVSNHQPHDWLLNRLFRRRSKKTSKLRVTGLCAGNSPGTSKFPAQMASNAKNVSIWWRHHVSDNFTGQLLIIDMWHGWAPTRCHPAISARVFQPAMASSHWTIFTPRCHLPCLGGSVGGGDWPANWNPRGACKIGGDIFLQWSYILGG